MKTNANEEAFSRAANLQAADFGAAGLTKREYFAAMAMQGLLSDVDWTIGAGKERGFENAMKTIMSMSVNAANSLIDELNKEK